jgi:hypothetical protein
MGGILRSLRHLRIDWFSEEVDVALECFGHGNLGNFSQMRSSYDGQVSITLIIQTFLYFKLRFKFSQGAKQWLTHPFSISTW